MIDWTSTDITRENRLVEHALCDDCGTVAIEEFFPRKLASFNSYIHTYIYTYICIYAHSRIGNFASNFAKCKSRCDKRSGVDLSAKLSTFHGARILCACASSLKICYIDFSHPHWELTGKYQEQILSRAAQLWFLFHFIAHES